MTTPIEGILLLDKPTGITSFHLVAILRRLTNIRKIGHAGTLDPFATGLMVMLIGKNYTRKSASFINHDKAYKARLRLGAATDTYDLDGTITSESDRLPSQAEIKDAIASQQGDKLQVPPMYSAKKVGGKKLYELARKGEVIERAPVPVQINIEEIDYTYPHLDIDVSCSKGTYIRSIAHEIGEDLGCGAHLQMLIRTRSGPFNLDDALALDAIEKNPALIEENLLK